MSAGWPLFWFAASVFFALTSAGFFVAAWRDEDLLLVILSGSAFVVFAFFAVVTFLELS